MFSCVWTIETKIISIEEEQIDQTELWLIHKESYEACFNDGLTFDNLWSINIQDAEKIFCVEIEHNLPIIKLVQFKNYWLLFVLEPNW